MIKPQRFQATISKREKISSKVYEVKFRLIHPSNITFLAGHTIMIYVAPGVNRSMSIASPPKEKNEITMCWDISPMGIGCQWLLSKNIGDPVEFMAPLGVFTYDATSPRRAVFVATGTGVAPFKAALEEFLSTGTMKPSILYWGLRHEEDIFWVDRLSELQNQYPSFRYQLTLSQPSDEWMGMVGRVEMPLFAQEKDLGVSDFYLCGSGKMVEEMYKKLIEKGVPTEQIKRELFFKT